MEVIIISKDALYIKNANKDGDEYIVRKYAIATIDFITNKDSKDSRDKGIIINVIAENENILLDDFTDEEYELIKETLLEWMKM